MAIACGDVKIGELNEALDLLIKYGADVNVTDDEGRNFAHYAVDNYESTGLDDALIAITSAGGDINHRDKNGDNAWHYLYKREKCLQGFQLRALGKLLDAGLDSDVPDGDGKKHAVEGLLVSWDIFDYLSDGVL